MYTITVNETRNENGNPKGYASLVFDDKFRINNIAIIENDKGQLFVSMPRYRSNAKDELGNREYKDVCNPITKDFRKELYDTILDTFANISDKAVTVKMHEDVSLDTCIKPNMRPFEKDGSNIRAIGHIYIDDCFVINNVSVLAGKDDNLFVSMPNYKSNEMDENNHPVYKDICFPVTKEFRSELYKDILDNYRQAKDKQVEEAAEKVEKATKEKTEEKEREPEKKQTGKKRS